MGYLDGAHVKFIMRLPQVLQRGSACSSGRSGYRPRLPAACVTAAVTATAVASAGSLSLALCDVGTDEVNAERLGSVDPMELRDWILSMEMKGTSMCARPAEEGHIRVIRALLNAGANPALEDERGRTPLHTAAWKGYAGIIELLLLSDKTLVDRPDRKYRGTRTRKQYAFLTSHLLLTVLNVRVCYGGAYLCSADASGNAWACRGRACATQVRSGS